MKWLAAGLAFAAVAAAGALIALGTATGAPADTTVSTVATGTTTVLTMTTDGSTVSASSSVTSSCIVSSTSVNGVTSTHTSGCDASAQACSVAVSVNDDVTISTQSGDCGAVVSVKIDLRELRRLVSSWIWFLFAAAR